MWSYHVCFDILSNSLSFFYFVPPLTCRYYFVHGILFRCCSFPSTRQTGNELFEGSNNHITCLFQETIRVIFEQGLFLLMEHSISDAWCKLLPEINLRTNSNYLVLLTDNFRWFLSHSFPILCLLQSDNYLQN